MKTKDSFVAKHPAAWITLALCIGAICSRAGIISVNLTDFANDNQQIDADETFGIESQGTVVGGWVNLYRTVNVTGLAFSYGASSTVSMTGTTPNSFGSYNGAYANTPLLGGIDDYTGTANPTSITLNNLAENFPNGYKVIVYLCAFNLNTGASISDGTTTFYYRPLNPPVAPVTFVQTTETTDLGDGNAPIAQYAVFGEPTLLTANTITFRVDTLYGGGSGLGGFQIIGDSPTDELVRIWTGSSNSDWDADSSNWLNSSLLPTNYVDGAVVLFDDRPAASSPTVNLTATRNASRLNVDSTKDYTFTGSDISGSTGLIKMNTGSLTLNNANTYSGNTAVEGGILKIGTADAIPDSAGKGDVSVASGATLDLNGISEGINGLSGAGTIDSTAGPATITIGLDNDASTFNGTIQGALTIVKRGTNTLALPGPSYYTGETLVQEGELRLDAPASFLTGGALVISNGARLTVSLTNGAGMFSSSTLSLNGGTVLKAEYGDASLTGFLTPITTSGALNLEGLNQIAISGSGFPVGTYTLINYGSKTGGGSISSIPASIPTGMIATIVDTGSAINLVVTFPSVQTLLWTLGDGEWATNGMLSWNYGTAEYKEYPNGLGDAVQFDTSSSGTVSLPNDVRPYSVKVDGNYVLIGPGRITGGTGIERLGSTTATFILNNSNNYTGVTKVTQGSLQINHPGALGSTVGSTVVTNGGSLVLSNGITLAGEPLVLSGDGTASNNGAVRSVDTNSPVTIASPITLSGNARIRVNNGELSLTGQVADQGSNYMVTLHAGGSGVLHMNSASNQLDRLRTYGFNLDGGRIIFGAENVSPGARLIAGGGIVDLNGFGQIFAGIEPGSDTANGRITNSTASAVTLLLNGTNEVATPISLAGAINLVRDGIGRQALNGLNFYSGTTEVNSGILRINGDSSGATNTWTVNGGSLEGDGIIGGPVFVAVGGSLVPGSTTAAIGTLTISNNLTLNGNIVIGLDKNAAQSNDVVNVTGTLTYGGTLTVMNLGTTQLAVGDQFSVFPPGGSGTFGSIVSDPGVTFDFNDGSLMVKSAGAGPTLNYTLLSGGVLQFDWTGPYKLQWQTNLLSLGLGNNWTDYPDMSNPVNVTNDLSSPTAFFRLISH